MGSTLNLLYGALAGTVSLITMAVCACLAAAGRADKQAARMRIPVRSRGQEAYSRASRIDSTRN